MFHSRACICILFCFVANIGLMAQFPFSSSTNNSGVVNLHEDGGINYDFSSSRLGMNIRGIEDFKPTDTLRRKRIFYDFMAGAALNKNTFALFQETFQPGVDMGYGVTWVNALEDTVKTDWFIYNNHGVRYAFQNNKVNFAFEDTRANIVVKEDGIKQVHALTYSYNRFRAYQNKGIVTGLAASLTFGQRNNDDAGLSTREFCTYEANGVDEGGNPAFITKCSEVKFGELKDQWFITPRVDGLARIAELEGNRTDENTFHNPAIYLLGSYFVEFTEEDDDAKHSFISGFSMTQYSRSIIAALLFELTDFTSGKSLNEKLAVKFYLGVPLNFKSS